MTDAAIEQREPDALSKILGTSDTRAMLEQVEANVKAVIEIARDRGFVTRFNQRDFFGFPAWSLLALTYGIVPIVEWTRPIDGGWEARAVARTRDGDVVGSAEAMCTRQEPARARADDHTLRAMAQTRAMRNALRSCLGSALVMAGYDFADPQSPATREQIGVLHILERELGWPHDEAHEVANVSSYKDLSREEAADLIDQWSELRDDLIEKAGGSQTPPSQEPVRDFSSTRNPRPSPPSGADNTPAIGESAPEYGDPPGEPVVSVPGKGGAAPTHSGDPHHTDDDEPAPPEAWARVPKTVTTVALIKLAAKLVNQVKMPGPAPTSRSQFTKVQLALTIAAYLDGERG